MKGLHIKHWPKTCVQILQVAIVPDLQFLTIRWKDEIHSHVNQRRTLGKPECRTEGSSEKDRKCRTLGKRESLSLDSQKTDKFRVQVKLRGPRIVQSTSGLAHTMAPLTWNQFTYPYINETKQKNHSQNIHISTPKGHVICISYNRFVKRRARIQLLYIL